MDWVYDDGGRAATGYKGSADDCVTRAIAIATGLPYREVYDAINELAKLERPRQRTSVDGIRRGVKARSNARLGVTTATQRRYLTSLGWTWTPTMQIGSGCKVHLVAEELPAGRLIVRVSKHVCAVVDGVIHDTHDPSRDETRCVYGFWS